MLRKKYGELELRGTDSNRKTVFTIFKAFIASGILFLPNGVCVCVCIPAEWGRAQRRLYVMEVRSICRKSTFRGEKWVLLTSQSLRRLTKPRFTPGLGQKPLVTSRGRQFRSVTLPSNLFANHRHHLSALLAATL